MEINLFIYRLNSSAGVVGDWLQMAIEAAEIPYKIIDLSALREISSDITAGLYTILTLLPVMQHTVHPQRCRLFGIDLQKIIILVIGAGN